MKPLHLLTLLFVFLFACSKDETSVVTNDDEKAVSNKIGVTIAIPENSEFLLEDLTIRTPFESENLSGRSAFVTKTNKNHYSSFVSKNDSILLIGYHGPGITENVIDCKSTLTSLVMGSFSLFNFADDLKGELALLIRQQATFQSLADQMETELIAGNYPINFENTDFTTGFNTLVSGLYSDTSVANKIKRYFSDAPLEYRTINNQVTVLNPGLSFASVVGVYRDGNKIGLDKILGGVNFVPTNLGSILSQGSSAIGFTNLPTALNPVASTITMEGGGQFELKIRTGCPKDFEALQNDEEAQTALRENLTAWAASILFEIIPWDELADAGLQVGNITNCLLGIIPEVLEGYGNFSNLSPGISLGEVFGLCMNIVGEVLGIALTLGQNCLAFVSGSGFSYSQQLERYARMLGRIGIIGNTLNLGIGLGQWFYKDARMDLCFEVEEGIAQECETSQLDVFYDILSLSDLSFEVTQTENELVASTLGYERAAVAVFDNEERITQLLLNQIDVSSIHPNISKLNDLVLFVCYGNPLTNFPDVNASNTLKEIIIEHACPSNELPGTFPVFATIPEDILALHPNLERLWLSGNFGSIPTSVLLELVYLKDFRITSTVGPVPIPDILCENLTFGNSRAYSFESNGGTWMGCGYFYDTFRCPLN